MKLIHKFKSPNFNKRQSKKIKYLIIHYTALKDCSESLKYLCDKSKKVSSHYLSKAMYIIWYLKKCERGMLGFRTGKVILI